HLCLCTRPPRPDRYTLSLHDALPICPREPLLGGVYAGLPRPLQTSHRGRLGPHRAGRGTGRTLADSSRLSDQRGPHVDVLVHRSDRKSTRLNSSHVSISYAVFCLTKK